MGTGSALGCAWGGGIFTKGFGVLGDWGLWGWGWIWGPGGGGGMGVGLESGFGFRGGEGSVGNRGDGFGGEAVGVL